jgi:hypothetical protein
MVQHGVDVVSRSRWEGGVRAATVFETRDLFGSGTEVRGFVQAREADIMGGSTRIGVAFRFERH